ncbi:MAG: NADH dehydrogenase [Syntrophobacterales bacterium RBG_19FT_COMBO_59_10]|nr:MAG: NADH dehydrogenase [Syntrophobacterales bacterium RBG_19FT_COMBO_59_10]
MMTLTINGKRTEVSGGTILDVAKANGIRIPTLCHHPALASQGACRLCLVEVKGMRALQPACTFPVTEGMEVQTDSPKVRAARKFVLELLLSDHPQDCMTCEMCGNCTLQDLIYEYGVKENLLAGERHLYPLDDRDPFILRDMEKCIRCRRCIRACDEIQAVNAITMINRGFRSKVAAAFDTRLQDSNCVFCGQCISVCPTGALTEKDSHGLGRAWQIEKVTTICPYCGVGCTFDLNLRDGRVIKATSNWNDSVNRGVLCVKGRFGWQFLHNPDRLTRPLMRSSLWREIRGTEGTPAKYDGFVETDWETALDTVADRLSAAKTAYDPDAVGILASAKCTNEENYLVQKLARREIGTNNVDHCARL